jgi:hypothetical protein
MAIVSAPANHNTANGFASRQHVADERDVARPSRRKTLHSTVANRHPVDVRQIDALHIVTEAVQLTGAANKSQTERVGA